MYTSITACNVRVGMMVAIPSRDPGLNLAEVVSVDPHRINNVETDRLIVSVKNAPYAFVIARWQYLIVTTDSMAMQVNNYAEILSWLEVGTDTPQ